jgi:hypothetical protein
MPAAGKRARPDGLSMNPLVRGRLSSWSMGDFGPGSVGCQRSTAKFVPSPDARFAVRTNTYGRR